jgi:protein-S-isoprenylcysteine O-methyltransferase Ste14
MKKLSFTLAAILLYQIVPLLWAPRLLLHWKMLAIITAAATLWLSQPALRPREVEADRHTVWLILAMAGVSTIVPEVEWAYLRADQAGGTVWNLAGLALMVGGTGYRIWAIRTLGKHFSATVQTADTQTLITSGPYRNLRHPSYLGAFVAVVGCTVLLQAWVGAAVAACAMLYAYYQRITVEESALSAHFGETYRDYQIKTWRMLPGVW